MYNIHNDHLKELKVSYPETVLSIKSTASKLDAIYFFISGLELKKKMGNHDSPQVHNMCSPASMSLLHLLLSLPSENIL